MVSVFQEVNLKELAGRIADDLQISDSDLEQLKNGRVPSGWSDSILDNLTEMYNFEGKLIDTLLEF